MNTFHFFLSICCKWNLFFIELAKGERHFGAYWFRNTPKVVRYLSKGLLMKKKDDKTKILGETFRWKINKPATFFIISLSTLSGIALALGLIYLAVKMFS